MKKNKRIKYKILIMCLSVIMLLQSFTTVSYAANTYEPQEYFRFIESNARMDSSGNFEVYFYVSVDSDVFIPNSNEMYVYTYIRMFNEATNSVFTGSDVVDIEDFQYTVTLYKIGFLGICVAKDSYTGVADGGFYYGNFEVEAGDRYFITIKRSSDINSGTGLYFDGTGKVGNVTLE